MPALLKSRSRRPNRVFVVANSARTESGSFTSVGTARHRDAASPALLTALFSRSDRRPANTTLYPSAASASATARPIPVPAPVTIAIFGVSLIGRGVSRVVIEPTILARPDPVHGERY